MITTLVNELSLTPPSAIWSPDEIAAFNAFFADNAGSFCYSLFLDYLFFPMQRRPHPRLCLVPDDGSTSGVRVGVFRQPAIDGSTGEVAVGVREIPLSLLAGPTDELEAVRELRETVNALRLLSHPNIVRYRSTLQCESSLYVLREYEPKACALRTILESFGPMKESTVRRYLAQALEALQYLHSHGIPHGSVEHSRPSCHPTCLYRLCVR